MSRSTRTISRSTSTARPGRAARASTRLTRPSGSRTCRPGSSSRCRTRSRSSRTRRRRCASCAPGSTSRAGASAGRAFRSAQVADRHAASAPRRSAPTTIPTVALTDHRVKVTVNLREGAPGRARRLHRGAPGRGSPPGARGVTAALTLAATCSGAPTEHLEQDLGDGSPRRRAPARPRAGPRADRALHRLRPAAQRRASSTATARSSHAAPRREPVAYILGEWGFRRLTLAVDRRALIPRPETEIVVERCRARCRASTRPACWMSAPAPARSPSRSPTSIPALGSRASTSRRTRSRSRARTLRGRASMSSCSSTTCARAAVRAMGPRRLESAVRRAGGARDADARRP